MFFQDAVGENRADRILFSLLRDQSFFQQMETFFLAKKDPFGIVESISRRKLDLFTK